MSDIIVSDGGAVSHAQPNQIVLSEPLPLDENPAAVYIASRKSDSTRRNARRYLAQIANGLLYGRWLTPSREDYDSSRDYRSALEDYLSAALTLDWSALRYQHTQAIQVKLMELYPHSPGSVNVIMSVLRGVIEEAWNLGQMSADDYQRAVNVKNIKVETLPAGRDLQQGEILALVTTCLSDDSAAGVRDAAIIGMLYSCGMRRSEPVKLTLNDYDPDSGQLKIISGKGRKDRTAYVTNGAKDALDDWLTVRGDLPGPLFAPVLKSGKIARKRDGTPRGMTAQAVYNLLKKRAEQAGVKDFSPHDFRRTFVGDLLDRGVDIVTVQKLAGHASVETTGRYDRRPEVVKQQAAQKLHYPYKRRRLV